LPIASRFFYALEFEAWLAFWKNTPEGQPHKEIAEELETPQIKTRFCFFRPHLERN